MPRIRQQTSQISIGAGPTGDSASAQAFGPTGKSSVALGSALLSIGGDINSLALKRQQEEKKDKAIEDAVWLGKATSSLMRNLTDYQNDPQNNSSYDYDKNFLNHADTLLQDLAQQAPSPEISKEFTARASAGITGRYGTVSRDASNTRLSTHVRSIEDRWKNNQYDFRNAPDSQLALPELSHNGEQIRSDIKEAYGEISPKLANQLIAKQVEQEVLAVMGNHPDRALELLKQSKEIDPVRRDILTRRINSAKQVSNIAEKDGFNRFRADVILKAKKEGLTNPLPLESYLKFYDQDRAMSLLSRDEDTINAYNKAHDFVSNHKQLIPNSFSEKMAEFGRETVETEEAYSKVVVPALNSAVSTLENDPVSWLQKNNPEVQKHQDEAHPPIEKRPAGDVDSLLPGLDRDGEAGAEPAPIPATPEELTKLHNSILKYQGFPDKDATNKGQYLRRPPEEKNLLSKPQADSLAGQINGSPPETAIQIISGVLEGYPDDEHKRIVMNDLASLASEPISQEYQLAYEYRNQPWADEYVGSLKNVKEIQKLTDVSKRDISSEIQVNPKWLSYQASMLGGASQRASELGGFKRGIETFASSLVANGQSPEKAAQIAVDRLVGSSFGFTAVSGATVSNLGSFLHTPISEAEALKEKPNTGIDGARFGDTSNFDVLPVPRARKDGSIRSDKEIQLIGDQLGTAIMFVSPQEMNPGQFPQELQAIEDKDERNNVMFETYVRNATYRLSDDGQGVLLYLRNDKGGSTPFRTKSGFMLKLDFDNIPADFLGGNRFDPDSSDPRIRQSFKFRPKERNKFNPFSAEKHFTPTGSFWEKIK